MKKNTVKDYSSIYGIKTMVTDEMMPKYFQGKVNDLNVGVIGMTTDVISTGIEDGFSAMTQLIKEMLPTTASLPETLLANAAAYRVDDILATPAHMAIALMVNTDDIKLYSKPNEAGTSMDFRIDSESIININGVPYSLDYDIIIQSKEYGGKAIYNTLYNFNHKNILNKDNSPYLKNLLYKSKDGNFVAIMCVVHQVKRTSYSETLISNTIINFPKYKFEFDDMLANIDVYYRAPGRSKFEQLEKLPKDSVGVDKPFFYYSFLDMNTLEISFASSNRFFRPEFNSELKFDLYTTKGEVGNFETTNLPINNIEVLPASSEYEYMPSINMHCVVQSDSYGAKNRLSTEELKMLVNKKFASINSIVNTTDLSRDFLESKLSKEFDIAFEKKRDDAFDRQFSAFTIFRSDGGDVMHCNTLNLLYNYVHSHANIGDNNALTIKPGTLFTYTDNDSYKNIKMIDGHLGQGVDHIEDKFIFTNPFLMNVVANPNDVVGFYLNSTDKRYMVSYEYMNMDSKDQFICNVFGIKRNAMMGEDTYKIKVNISPSTDLSVDPFDKDKNWLDVIKLRLFFDDGTGDLNCYIPFKFDSYDKADNIFSFSTELKTDDFVTLSEKMRVLDVYDIDTAAKCSKVIPYDNLVAHLNVFIERGVEQDHRFNHLPELNTCQLSNTYSSTVEKITLMKQFGIINSYVEYSDNGSGNPGNFDMVLAQLPVTSARDMLIPSRHMELVQHLIVEYDYLNSRKDMLTNNYSLDLKFISTYGKSRLFTINSTNEDLLDSLNCRFKFMIKTIVGTDKKDLEVRLKRFIHRYFESVNSQENLSIKVSNLIQEIENNFVEVDYLIFQGINDYDTSIQVIKNNSLGIFGKDSAPIYDMYEQIPEYATVREDDITLIIQ